MLGHRLLCQTLLATLHKHLFGSKTAHKFGHIIDRALGGKKLACRDVKKRHSGVLLAEMYGGKEVVLAMIKHIVVD